MLAFLGPFVAGLIAGAALQYLSHRLQLRREGRGAQRVSRRETADRLRAALQPWVANSMALLDASHGTLTELGLDPSIEAATTSYEAGRAAVAIEPGGETLEKLYRNVVRSAHLLRAETHAVFELIKDQDHLAGGAVAQYWQEERATHQKEEKALQNQLQAEIREFLHAVEARLGEGDAVH